MGNNAGIGDVHVGEGTVFITPGDVTFGNNCSFAGLLYSEGTVIIGNNMDFEGLLLAGNLEDIGENSTFTLNPDVLDWDSILGLGGGEEAGTEITTWDEVY